MRSNIKKVFWFYFILFLALIIYLLYFTLVDAPKICNSSYNPRNTTIEENIINDHISSDTP